MKQIILILALVLAGAFLFEARAQSLAKITSVSKSVDGCNTITCYEGGWCAETAVYCYPKKAVALIGSDNLTPVNPLYGSETITLPAKPLTIKRNCDQGAEPLLKDESELVSIPEDASDGSYGWLITPAADDAWQGRTNTNPFTYITQPNVVAVTFVTSIEQATGGNGAIFGLGLYHNHNFTGIPGAAINTKLSLTWDKKNYLNRYGVAPRLHTDFRYHLPIASDNHRTFLQAGIVAGGVQYSGDGGYAKFGVQPAVGFGFDLSPDNQEYSMVATYKYKFRSPLYGQQSFFNSSNRIKDGWSSGFEVGLEGIFALNKIIASAKLSDNWVFIMNVAGGRTTYQRNAQYYGAVLGAEQHRIAYADISIGFGRRY